MAISSVEKSSWMPERRILYWSCCMEWKRSVQGVHSLGTSSSHGLFHADGAPRFTFIRALGFLHEIWCLASQISKGQRTQSLVILTRGWCSELSREKLGDALSLSLTIFSTNMLESHLPKHCLVVFCCNIQRFLLPASKSCWTSQGGKANS